ncbi:MAG: hypothetical protein B7Y83_14200, partial [Flavobacteriales bacterium 32-34-25]
MNRIVKSSLLLLSFTTLLISCKKSEALSEEVMNDIATEAPISSSAAVEKKDSTRKFVRTADLKFKVKSVPQTTYAIENITNKFGGFVTFTNLQSNIIDQYETKISQDST